MTIKLNQKINKIISLYFPNIDLEKIQFYEGFDFVTVIIDQLALRFPKNQDSVKKLKTEKMLLKFLAEEANFSIPEYQANSNKFFSCYPVIRGEELTLDFYNSLTEIKKNKLCEDLAVFMLKIHSLKLPENISSKIPIANWSKIYLGIKKDIDVYLYPSKSNEKFLALFKDFSSGKRRVALVHSDLSGDNIIINKTKKRIEGIIDFSDMCFSDPDVDFAHFWYFGEKMVKKVVFFYTKDKNERKLILRNSKLYSTYIKYLMMIIENKKGV